MIQKYERKLADDKSSRLASSQLLITPHHQRSTYNDEECVIVHKVNEKNLY